MPAKIVAGVILYLGVITWDTRYLYVGTVLMVTTVIVLRLKRRPRRTASTPLNTLFSKPVRRTDDAAQLD